ncbi:DUF6973 domain-containing protein [Nocardia otitidiscaviarum]|uniref:DUF6973 domain-containing protein n=1 Tax=Nocardia otitidiscaviarum TaxID=1823 RepID=UPI001892D62B|nr:hypothetical protein [Nocardia otitidiscaviarum]MBF6179581.1 hypothetical protein [Nocardia otitidiscaviarum]
MSEESKLTVPVLLGWNLNHLRDVVTTLQRVGPELEKEMTGAADEFAKSDDYFVGDGGTKARERSANEKTDGLATVDIYEKLAGKITPIVDTFETELDRLKEAVAETEDSKWELFYSDHGEVKSHQSNYETAKSNWWAPLTAIAEKELEILTIGNKFREALTKIRSTDAATYEIAGVVEDLTDRVKYGLANIPTDPKLASILLENQVGTEEMEVWPSGALLDAILVFNPNFVPVAMTKSEISALEDIATKAPWKLQEFYDIKTQATNTAQEVFPDSVNDGQGDAFRHAYWNALMTTHFSEEFAARYATAHEYSGGQPSHREAMDLHNNDLGRRIAVENPGATPEELKVKVVEAINQGRAVVIGSSTDGGAPQIGWSGGPNGIPEQDTGLKPGTYVPLPGR